MSIDNVRPDANPLLALTSTIVGAFTAGLPMWAKSCFVSSFIEGAVKQGKLDSGTALNMSSVGYADSKHPA
jgi:hypothetical protein